MDVVQKRSPAPLPALLPGCPQKICFTVHAFAEKCRTPGSVGRSTTSIIAGESRRASWRELNVGHSIHLAEAAAALLTVLYRRLEREDFSLPYFHFPDVNGQAVLSRLFVDVAESLPHNADVLQRQNDAWHGNAHTQSQAFTHDSITRDCDLPLITVMSTPTSLQREAIFQQLSSIGIHAALVWDRSTDRGFWLSDPEIQAALATLEQQLATVYAAANRHPAKAARALNIICEEEAKWQLENGLGNQISLRLEPVIHQLERQALIRPDKIAIHCRGRSLSYAALNAHANALAHGLVKSGVKPGDRVAVLLEPAVEILVAITAIHKAGGVYVPLDPGFPPARLRAILQDCTPAFALCWSNQTLLTEHFPLPYLDIHLLCDTAIPEIPAPVVHVSLQDRSHIFYTSGTTGKPKGVVSTHKNLAHNLAISAWRYGFEDTDVFVSLARFTFSISTFELFAPLCAGGELHILDQQQALHMPTLYEMVQRASVFHAVPNLLGRLLEHALERQRSGDKPMLLRTLLTGGDMVPALLLEKAASLLPNAAIYVNYGSSETSCMACTYPLPRNRRPTVTRIGRPHANMAVRILDRFGNLLPRGAVGMLYFSGDGLVEGYLNNPELNANKFKQIDGERFFEIGDLGRFDEDGNIELLGRTDFQIQVNGIRVEAQEIEYHLKKIPPVRDCVIVGRTLEEDGVTSLAAYVVVHDEHAITPIEINESLAETLPAYMIPAIYIKLDRLPTNHNGKIDRSQLPAASAENLLGSSTEDEAPESDIESGLLEIWRKLFDMDGLHRNHNFFEIGGNSLKAVQLAMSIENAFGRPFPLPKLIDHPTVREIAQFISTDVCDDAAEVTLIKQGDPQLPPLYCLNGVLQYRDVASALKVPNPVYGVTLAEEVQLVREGRDSAAFKIVSDFEAILDRYLALIRQHRPIGPYYLCGASFGGIIAFELARRLKRAGDYVAPVVLFDTWIPGFMNSLPYPLKLLRFMQKLFSDRPRLPAATSPTERPRKRERSMEVRQDIRAVARELALQDYRLIAAPLDVLLFSAVDRIPMEYAPRRSDLGWGTYALGVTVEHVPGDHIGMLKGANADLLGKLLSRYMQTWPNR